MWLSYKKYFSEHFNNDIVTEAKDNSSTSEPENSCFEEKGKETSDTIKIFGMTIKRNGLLVVCTIACIILIAVLAILAGSANSNQAANTLDNNSENEEETLASPISDVEEELEENTEERVNINTVVATIKKRTYQDNVNETQSLIKQYFDLMSEEDQEGCLITLAKCLAPEKAAEEIQEHLVSPSSYHAYSYTVQDYAYHDSSKGY